MPMPRRLLEGLQHFRSTELARYAEVYRQLAEAGQHPRVLLVTCSDSRIVPSLITESGPGEMFVARTIGNIVAPPGAAAPDATLAAVEYAVAALGIRNVIVCGHSSCGAMGALYEGLPADLPHLAAWIEHARPAALSEEEAAACRDTDERDLRSAQRNVVLSLERLAAHPLVEELRSDGEVALHGWLYDIASASVSVLDQTTGEFVEFEEVLEQADD